MAESESDSVPETGATVGVFCQVGEDQPHGDDAALDAPWLWNELITSSVLLEGLGVPQTATSLLVGSGC